MFNHVLQVCGDQTKIEIIVDKFCSQRYLNYKTARSSYLGKASVVITYTIPDSYADTYWIELINLLVQGSLWFEFGKYEVARVPTPLVTTGLVPLNEYRALQEQWNKERQDRLEKQASELTVPPSFE